MQYRALLALTFGLPALGGCSFGTTQVEVAHSPMAPPVTSATSAPGETILVQRFVDDRPAEQRQYIGNKRNGLGLVLGHVGMREGERLEDVMTQAFVDALRHAGYRAVVQPPPPAPLEPYAAVLEGRIRGFWLDLYMATWHAVDVKLILKDHAGTHALWDRKVHGEKTNVLWVGQPSEYENVIRGALDAALENAAREFVAAPFHDAVKQANPATSACAPEASEGAAFELAHFER
jgi:hypothetical protein